MDRRVYSSCVGRYGIVESKAKEREGKEREKQMNDFHDLDGMGHDSMR